MLHIFIFLSKFEVTIKLLFKMIEPRFPSFVFIIFEISKFCGILSTELLDLAKNLEFPFIKVLLNMEENGIKMDISSLKEMINEIAEQLKILTNWRIKDFL